LSILRRISLALVLLAGCSPEQSANIGAQPKKTVDRVTTDVNRNLQQGGQDSDRLKDSDAK